MSVKDFKSHGLLKSSFFLKTGIYAVLKPSMQSTQELIEASLLRLCRQGQFDAIALFNDEGILMAEVGECLQYAKETLITVALAFRQTVEVFRDFQAEVSVDEQRIRTSTPFRIIIRPVPVGKDTFILVAVAPSQAAYRHITTQAIKAIQCAMR